MSLHCETFDTYSSHWTCPSCWFHRILPEKENEIKIGQIINNIRNNGYYINNDPVFRAQLLKNGFVMNVDEERGNLIKEQMRKYDNPNKARTYVEKNLDPALAIQIL